MAKPRYSPRDFALYPSTFGTKEKLKWKLPSSAREEAYLRAAQLQNLYSFRIREQARIRRVPLNRIAVEAEFSHARLLRCLRGEIVMRLDDLGWADRVLRTVSEIAVNHAKEQKELEESEAALRRLEELSD